LNARPGWRKFSLVLPTYNEADNILAILERAHAALNGIDHEIIVVDDNSPDGTGRVVDAFARDHLWVRCLGRVSERGLSRAVIAGFEAAQGDVLGVMDADLSHDPVILPRLIAAVDSGAEVAVGSRRVPGGGADRWPWFRRFTSEVATRLARGILNAPLKDPMSGYFVIARRTFETCRRSLRSNGYKILLEIICTADVGRIEEIPYVFQDRRQGHSKLSFAVMAQYLQMLASLLFRKRRRARSATTSAR
jgi:dolichol-phosphate mannosyltransferase